MRLGSRFGLGFSAWRWEAGSVAAEAEGKASRLAGQDEEFVYVRNGSVLWMVWVDARLWVAWYTPDR